MSGALMDQLENINPDGRGRKLMPPTKPYTTTLKYDGKDGKVCVWASSPEAARVKINDLIARYWPGATDLKEQF